MTWETACGKYASMPTSLESTAILYPLFNGGYLRGEWGGNLHCPQKQP